MFRHAESSAELGWLFYFWLSSCHLEDEKEVQQVLVNTNHSLVVSQYFDTLYNFYIFFGVSAGQHVGSAVA